MNFPLPILLPELRRRLVSSDIIDSGLGNRVKAQAKVGRGFLFLRGLSPAANVRRSGPVAIDAQAGPQNAPGCPRTICPVSRHAEGAFNAIATAFRAVSTHCRKFDPAHIWLFLTTPPVVPQPIGAGQNKTPETSHNELGAMDCGLAAEAPRMVGRCHAAAFTSPQFVILCGGTTIRMPTICFEDTSASTLPVAVRQNAHEEVSRA